MVPTTDPHACSFCTLGLIFKAGGGPAEVETLMAHIGGPVSFWNDDPSRTISDVRKLFNDLRT